MNTLSFRSGILAASLILIGLSSAHAMEPATEEPAFEATLLQEAPFDASALAIPEYSDEDIAKLKAMKPAQRNPAGDPARLMSAEFTAVRDRFLKVKTADELDAVLLELDSKYDSFKNADTKLFAAQAVTLLPLRGFIWRVIPVASKARVTHSAVLTFVKQLSQGIGIFLPTQQWDAAFDYASTPFKRGNVVSTQFQSEGQIQAFLSSHVLRSLIKSVNRIKTIDLGGKEVVWDNKLLYGPASFQDDLDRYRLVGEVEKAIVQANLHSSIAQLCFGRAYSVDGSSKVAENLGRLYGIDALPNLNPFGDGGIQGAPSKDRVGVIRGAKRWGLLNGDGAQWTKASLSNIRASARILSGVWAQVKNRPAGESWSVDPSFFQSRDIVRTGDYRVEDVVAMTKGPAKIRSAVTGEKVLVNMPAFYENPPRDLKALLATGFNTKPEWTPMNFTVDGKTVELKARNYDSGSATNWDLGQYQSFLPEVKNGNDLKRAARVLSQSFGGSAALAPMLGFMM